MIQPINNISLEASAFGGEIVLKWELPVLPANPKIYVFKREKTAITQTEIDSYFLNITNLSTYNLNGLFVFDKESTTFSVLSDLIVSNGTIYFYSVVIRDQITGEVSSAVGGSATPLPLLQVSVKDGKKIVDIAIRKLMDNIYISPSQKIKLGKDFKTVFCFAIEPVASDYFMIERVNGASQYRIWGDQYANIQGKKVKGTYDTDVIRATFMTTDTPSRRDEVANIMRANKIFLRRLCKKLGAVDCDITLEGDYYNPQIHGVNAVGYTVVFNLLIEVFSLIPKEEEEFIIGDIIVDTQGQ
jgi:hypothetical protein